MFYEREYQDLDISNAFIPSLHFSPSRNYIDDAGSDNYLPRCSSPGPPKTSASSSAGGTSATTSPSSYHFLAWSPFPLGTSSFVNSPAASKLALIAHLNPVSPPHRCPFLPKLRFTYNLTAFPTLQPMKKQAHYFQGLRTQLPLGRTRKDILSRQCCMGCRCFTRSLLCCFL